MLNFQQLGLKPIVLLFNNETFRDSYRFIPYLKEPEVCYEGYPHVMLYITSQFRSLITHLYKFAEKQAEIKFLGENSQFLSEVSGNLRRSISPIMPDVLASEIKLSQKLLEAKFAEVSVGGCSERIKLPPPVRVYGKISDFKGNPRKDAYVMLVNPYGFPHGTAITKTDENGFYEMYAPAAMYHHAFICDGNYGNETLEFYGWNVLAEPPELKLDARFDKIEIYRLTAAETPERTIIVEFVPMDIAHTTKALKRTYELKGRIDPEDMCNEGFIPKLEKDDIKVYLNKKELEIRTFSQRYYLPKDLGVECLTPAFVVEAKIPRHLNMGRYNLKVVVNKSINGFEEWGESTLFGFNIW